MHRMWGRIPIVALVAIWIFSFFSFSAFASEKPSSYHSSPPSLASKAYQQFVLRPRSELSKLICLIDRFADSNIQILYDDQYYPASFIAPIARAFLASHYNHESAEDWVARWCAVSIPDGNPIWIKFQDGNSYRALDVLLEELKVLNHSVEGSSVFGTSPKLDSSRATVVQPPETSFKS